MRIELLLSPLLVVQQAGSGSTPTSPMPRPRWLIDGGNASCVMTRLTENQDEATFSLRLFPGGHAPEMVVAMGKGARSLPYWQVYGVRLAPSEFQGNAIGYGAAVASSGQVALRIYELAPEFLRRLGSANGLSLTTDGRQLIHFDLVGAGRAVEKFRECIDKKLSELGFDPKRVGTIEISQSELRKVFRPSDYPATLLRERREGTAIVRAVAGTDGRMTKCQVLESSGFEGLDTTSCQIIEHRSKVTPGRTPDGAAVAVPVVSYVSWRIPR